MRYTAPLLTVFFFNLPPQTDVDECQKHELNKCHEKANCSNTLGSYNCTCLDGYFGNGTHCQGRIIGLVLRSKRVLKKGLSCRIHKMYFVVSDIFYPKQMLMNVKDPSSTSAMRKLVVVISLARITAPVWKDTLEPVHTVKVELRLRLLSLPQTHDVIITVGHDTFNARRWQEKGRQLSSHLILDSLYNKLRIMHIYMTYV